MKNEEKLPSHKIPTDTPPDNGLPANIERSKRRILDVLL